ncbi:hypothetical protein L0P56_11015, partial [Anaerosalibacter bizertensis]|nr:hypothetical protein [Anaerosalibacter bizertensis]
MKAQITLTVNESKRIIARGLKEEPKIKNAFSYGKILLKGGTTVSAISEELINMPLGISGRISTNGTKGSKSELDAPHCILIDKGQVIDVDEEEKFEESALSMSKGD